MQVLITITDDELDYRRLKDAYGNPASKDKIIQKLNEIYTSYSVIISNEYPKKTPGTIFANSTNLFHIKPNEFSSKLIETIEMIKIKMSQL